MDLHPDEQVVFEGHPSWRALLAFYLGGVAGALAIAVVVALVSGIGLAIVIGAVLVAGVLLVGFAKRMATTYMVSSQRLYIRRGVLAKREQQTRIDRVQNVNTDQACWSACCASAPSTSTPRAATTASSASSGSARRATWSLLSIGRNARRPCGHERHGPRVLSRGEWGSVRVGVRPEPRRSPPSRGDRAGGDRCRPGILSAPRRRARRRRQGRRR